MIWLFYKGYLTPLAILFDVFKHLIKAHFLWKAEICSLVPRNLKGIVGVALYRCSMTPTNNRIHYTVLFHYLFEGSLGHFGTEVLLCGKGGG